LYNFIIYTQMNLLKYVFWVAFSWKIQTLFFTTDSFNVLEIV
jgi:hypothetical protein